MMELLVIKSKDLYLRITPDEYLPGDMAKASVFPMEKVDTVRQHATDLRKQGFEEICIKKLVIDEIPFEEGDVQWDA